MVTHTGANIITDARSLIDKVDKPLELVMGFDVFYLKVFLKILTLN